MVQARHRWSRNEDKKMLYISIFGVENSGYTLEEVARMIGISVTQLNARVAEFNALDGRKGLTHSCEQTRDVYKEFGAYPHNHMRTEAFNSD